MVNNEILKALEIESSIFRSPIHGLLHWKTVERNGLYLSQFTGADIKVVSLFAYFHDCMRENEWIDPAHGARGAMFAKKNRALLGLTDSQFELLFKACKGHTHGRKKPCKTISTCWDADRLDIGRVGTIPDSNYLFSSEAKRIADESDQLSLINFNVEDFLSKKRSHSL